MPLHSLQLLADSGQEVHLITNAPTEDRPDLPDILPKNIAVHYVDDGRKRTKVVDGVGGKGKGFKIGSLLKQMKQIKSIVNDNDLDIFHAYGYGRTATFAALLGYYGLKVPKVATLYGLPTLNFQESIIRRFWKSISLVSSTQYIADLCSGSNLQSQVIPSGPVRNLIKEMGKTPINKQPRVLFWRDPTKENGADICVEAFDKLAPKFPDVTFEMAIRPHWNEIDGINALQSAHKNVKIHLFPYEDGVTLADLVTGSSVVVLPFRKQSIHPQLAIAESLAAGIPVITSSLGSAPELVVDGETGFTVPVGDVTATTEAIEALLISPDNASKMGKHAAVEMKKTWGWANYVDEINDVYQKAMST